MGRSGSENRRMNHPVNARFDLATWAKLNELSAEFNGGIAETLRSLVRQGHARLPLAKDLVRELIAARQTMNSLAASHIGDDDDTFRMLRNGVARVDSVLRELLG